MLGIFHVNCSGIDKISGLDAGVDDYFVKTVDLQELFATIRVLLRRVNTSSTPILEGRNLRLNPSTYEVNYEHHPLHLTPKEYGLLKYY
jgi:DNA-binding response OmpR family regulator